jgi:NAD(P)-dependent dehydrogenase (short-subunit alcohol dehydrogenase family)
VTVADSEKRLAGRLALVTGASRGIGYHAALALAAEGAHVIALARTVGGLEELDDEIRSGGGEAATLVPLDVTDYDAIDRLGASIDERWGKLDIFVGNAAILGGLSPLGHYEHKDFQRVFDVNVTSNWRFIRSLDPLLRASDAGRVIFISSGAAHSCPAYWGPYAVSKAALEALARVYANECAQTNMRVNIFDPGVARTAMRAQAMPGEEAWAQTDPAEIAPYIVNLALPGQMENGRIYNFPRKRFMRPRKPA